MTIKELIDAYKKQVIICSKIDYTDMKTVKANNRAVEKMYSLIEMLHMEFDNDAVREFAKLLDIEEFNTKLWVAPQLLERLTLDKDIEGKALSIIEEVAKESLGFQYWLNDWHK